MKIHYKVDKQIIPIVVVACVLIGITVLIHRFAFLTLDLFDGLDLGPRWQVCLEGISTCETFTVNLPDKDQKLYKDKLHGKVEYRNTFFTPKQCIDPASNGCVLYIGGLSEGAEAILNGQPLGNQYSRSALYPASFPIPSSLLQANGIQNKLKLLVYSRDELLRPLINQGPVGIVSVEGAHVLTAGIVGEKMVLPLMCAAINFTLALTAFFWLLSKSAGRPVILSYSFFCIVAGFYMLNLTKLLQGFFGYQAGLSLNYFLRYLMDFALFSLVATFFSLHQLKFRILKFVYFVPISTFLVLFFLSMISPEASEAVRKIQFPKLGMVGFPKTNLVYISACFFAPLMLLGKFFGLTSAIKNYSIILGARVILLLFVIVLPMQFVDILTLLGVVRQNHEIYYMRLYSPFIALSFGYVIWLGWIARERNAEATLRVGEVAKGVAHDLRSPLTVLRILSNSSGGFAPEEKELLLSATKSIDHIASSILSQCRVTDKVAAPNIGILVSNAISDVIRSKNYFLAEKGKFKIKFDEPKEPSGFAKIGYPDFCRLLDNILNNAIDAVIENEAVVDISFPITVEMQTTNSGVKIIVSDFGRIVSESVIKRLNDKSFGITTKADGYGIGLSEVWRIVQEHKGDLVFAKGSQTGMVVRILLPR